MSRYLENQLCEYLSVKHCILTSSGTAALVAVLKSFSFPKNSEVILPAFTCPAVPFAVIYSGLKPVLCDIEIGNLCLSPKSVESKITNKTKAIIAVHTFGKTYNKGIIEIAKKHKIKLIEDACQSFGSIYDEQKHGTLAQTSVTSFGTMKVIDVGGGGAIFCNDDNLYIKIKDIVEKWGDDNYGYIMEKIRSKVMDAYLPRIKKHIHADLYKYLPHLFTLIYKFNQNLVCNRMPTEIKRRLEERMENIDQIITVRQRKADLYNRLLESFECSNKLYSDINNHLNFSVILKKIDRKLLIQKLGKRNIGKSPKFPYRIFTSYDKPLSILFRQGSFPNAELVSSGIVNFDISPNTSLSAIRYVSNNYNGVMINEGY